MRIKIKMKTGTYVHKEDIYKDDKYNKCQCKLDVSDKDVYGFCPYCGKEVE